MVTTPIWCSTEPNGSKQLVQANRIKGDTVVLFSNDGGAGLCELAVDTQDFNAVCIHAYPNGAGASATITVEGASSPGGIYHLCRHGRQYGYCFALRRS